MSCRHRLPRLAALLALLASGMAASPARAYILTDVRVQGGYYILQFNAQVDYPVDCRMHWQVRTSAGFTREGSADAYDVFGNRWNEVMGPMTQDAGAPSIRASCVMSSREQQRRADAEAQARARAEREREARERAQHDAQLRYERDRDARARAEREQQARDAQAKAQAEAQRQEEQRGRQAREDADEQARMDQMAAAERRREQIQQRAAMQAAQREEARRRAEQAAAQREAEARAREARIQQQRAAMAQATQSLGGMLQKQAGVADAELSVIAQDAAARVADMTRNQAASSATEPSITNEAAQAFLLSQVDLPGQPADDTRAAPAPGATGKGCARPAVPDASAPVATPATTPCPPMPPPKRSRP